MLAYFDTYKAAAAPSSGRLVLAQGAERVEAVGGEYGSEDSMGYCGRYRFCIILYTKIMHPTPALLDRFGPRNP